MYNFKIYNSMENKKVLFEPIDVNNIKVYACGPTVYDFAHIGNARMAVVFDTLIRILRHLYPRVTYVSNITDIDDKIIEKSRLEKLPIKDVTNKFSKIYNEDMEMLNVIKPNYQPKATEYVDKMIRAIKELENKGCAYYASNHVMFDITKYPNYGSLSSRMHHEQLAGSRVEVANYKRNSGDFVLWKPSKGDEPFWDSPWGKGRPGWHTECFVMATNILGTPFDIHGGGLDLKFPHHDNELAQSCCFSGNVDNNKSYAKYWMHNGFVTVNSEKMSKSLKNIKLVKDYLKLYDGEVIRLALMSAHYRSPLNWSEKVLSQSRNILNKYYKVIDELKDIKINKNIKSNSIIKKIEAALLDDLNISKAFSELDAQIKNISNKNSQEKKIIKEAILFISNVLGIFLKKNKDKKIIGDNILNENDIELLVNKRNKARKNKNFELADEIRKKLYDMGIEIKDDEKGTQWKKI
ncbi:MAG: cysteine--tRNA ligase [Rickettsiales bacterium]|nr:cysteine--tRNA ligase [Rickettsiales bacterium]OUV79577.1 MAG: cysteine--tRNA ligase [Rickettsiales bacterium TMED131]